MRIDVATHQQLKALAASMGASVGDTVTLPARKLRQKQIGAELRAELRPDKRVWLDADPG